MDAQAEAGSTSDEAVQAERTRLLGQLRGMADFPAVSRFLGEVLAATRSDSVSTQALSTLILKDFSLTNAVLRLVNSSYYRHASEQPISTISRAILLLGIDTVTNIAIGLTVFERLAGRDDVRELKSLTVRALLTGLYARQIAGLLPGLQPEEAFICGMMLDLGRLTVAVHLPDRYHAIQRAIADEGADEDTAARQVLAGLCYREIGQAMARAWNLPPKVQDTTGSDGDELAGAERDHLRATMVCARGLATAATVRGEHERAERIHRLTEALAARLPVTVKHLEALVAESASHVDSLAHALHLSRRDIEQAAPGLAPAAAAEIHPPAPAAPAQRDGAPAASAPAVPAAARRTELFVTALGEIGYAIAQDYPLNDVFMMILEGMYRTIGFEHVLLALITPGRTALRGRFGLGDRAQDAVAALSVPLGDTDSPIAQVITGPRDLLVADATAPAVRTGLPPGLLALLRPRTLMLLPLVIRGTAIGAFYVDRIAGQGPITDTDQRDLHVLLNQAVLAVRQAGKP